MRPRCSFNSFVVVVLLSLGAGAACRHDSAPPRQAAVRPAEPAAAPDPVAAAPGTDARRTGAAETPNKADVGEGSAHAAATAEEVQAAATAEEVQAAASTDEETIPEVTLGTPTTGDAIDPEVVVRFLEKRMAKLQECRAQSSRKWPHRRGRMVVSFVFMPSGKATEVEFKEDTTGDEAFKQCIRALMLRFNPPVRPPADERITVPMIFGRD